MTQENLQRTLATLGVLLGAMALVSVLEALVPLKARGPGHRAHLAPNLALTSLTLATNVVFNAALLALALWVERANFGLVRWLGLPAFAAAAVAVVVLDFSFYVAHVSWHKVPALWRIHAVHHCDPDMDVTTTIRQHPLENLIRVAVIAVTVVLVGASAQALAVYRTASAINALLEHANLRVPLWLDRALSCVTTWPYMHNVHHSRVPSETDSNYGNLFSFWDRIFGTFTPSSRGADVRFGVDGSDAPELQTTGGLLAQPFRSRTGPATPARYVPQ